MDMREFSEMVKPYAHEDDELIFDLRPFGERQVEAIDSYLATRVGKVNTTGLGNTERLVVLLCDATKEIPDSTRAHIEGLAASGPWVEIRHVRMARALAA